MIAAAILISGGAAFPDSEKAVAAPLDAALFIQITQTPAILRDGILDSRLNTVILARGVVRTIAKKERYKRKYCIVASDPEAERHNLKFRYNIFIESRDSIAMLKEGVTIEFTGQFMAYTPTSTYRNSYIVDILFEKGAVLVE